MNKNDEHIEAEPSTEDKLLRREVQAQALKRLEDSARSAKEFRKVSEWWDRLDANRERCERYYEILRENTARADR